MHGLRLAAVAGILLLAGTPAPAAAVSDDAFLAILSLSAGAGFGDDPGPGMLLAQLQATDDAPAGRIGGHVSFLVEDLDGAHPAQRINASFAFDVPAGVERRGLWQNVQANWTPERGLYNVTAELWADGASAPWDSWWTWRAAGQEPTLGDGWGHVHFPPAPSFDLDGDGADDVWLAENGTGKPLPRALDAYDSVRMGSGIASWSPQCGRGFSLELPDAQGAPVTRIRVSAAIVEAFAPGTTPLSMSAPTRGGPLPEPVDGSYEVVLGPDHFGTRADYVLFMRTCAKPETVPHTWVDGYRTVANITHWDLDADGAMDVRFWPTNASTPEEAHNETVAERRSEELVLVAEARVERRETLRRLTFELHRPDDGHDGAWVEIQDADRLFRALLQPAENATLSYRLSLPSNESFVERDGNTTWAWIGHFSTQTLTVEYGAGDAPRSETPASYPEEDQQSPTSPPTETEHTERRFPIPWEGLALALAAVGIAAISSRRR